MFARIIGTVFSSSRLRLYVWLSLASQILIVVTGGAVRLTASGLGCPTWPKCTDDSWDAVPEMGIHGIIEFGNRLLTFVLIIIALFTFVTVKRLERSERDGLVWTSFGLGLGIIVQAVIGGITVLTGLNSWIVGAHFLVSGALIAIATILVFNFYRLQKRDQRSLERIGIVGRAYRILGWPIVVVGVVSILFGIVVTGAGPHAGDADTPRNGFDLEIWQHIHSYPGYTLLALTLFALFAQFGASIKHNTLATRSLLWLAVASLAQAGIGILQSRLGVPPLLVGLHMLGAAVICSLLALVALVVTFGRK